MLGKKVEAGTVTTDSGGLVVIDPAYLMTDEDYDAGREPRSLAAGYDAVYVDTSRDGNFRVEVMHDRRGTPIAIHIDLRG